MKHLDLEEQEQLDKLKAFWKQFGNAISVALILVFGSIAMVSTRAVRAICCDV
jgi:predicted negative regulator of RcsB-dependent stress response